jgi:hypothetical protein
MLARAIAHYEQRAAAAGSRWEAGNDPVVAAAADAAAPTARALLLPERELAWLGEQLRPVTRPEPLHDAPMRHSVTRPEPFPTSHRWVAWM